MWWALGKARVELGRRWGWGGSKEARLGGEGHENREWKVFRGIEEHILTSGRNDQEVHLATVVEILQSIKQSEMSPMLSRIYGSEGGTETLDVLMKYL